LSNWVNITVELVYDFCSLFWKVGKETVKFLVEVLTFSRLAVVYWIMPYGNEVDANQILHPQIAIFTKVNSNI